MQQLLPPLQIAAVGILPTQGEGLEEAPRRTRVSVQIDLGVVAPDEHRLASAFAGNAIAEQVLGRGGGVTRSALVPRPHRDLRLQLTREQQQTDRRDRRVPA